MRYVDLDISVSITAGNGTLLALTGQDELLAVQQVGWSSEYKSINFGKFTKARAKELTEYLNRLAIHAVES